VLYRSILLHPLHAPQHTLLGLQRPRVRPPAAQVRYAQLPPSVPSVLQGKIRPKGWQVVKLRCSASLPAGPVQNPNHILQETQSRPRLAVRAEVPLEAHPHLVDLVLVSLGDRVIDPVIRLVSRTASAN
jgi:hypothetical protein